MLKPIPIHPTDECCDIPKTVQHKIVLHFYSYIIDTLCISDEAGGSKDGSDQDSVPSSPVVDTPSQAKRRKKVK